MRRELAWLALLCVGLCAAQSTPGLPGHFKLHSQYVYKNSTTGCDFNKEPCGPLSDVWGYTDPKTNRELAFVGVLNGIHVVDTTVPESPKSVQWWRGCLTEWRDLKAFGPWIFVVNDATSLCRCTEASDCERYVSVTSENTASAAGTLAVAEGAVTVPLADIPGQRLDGVLAVAEPYLACEELTNAASLSGKVVLVSRGECDYHTKVINAQNAGAIAVIVVNNRNDVVQPSMAGSKEGIVIPGASMLLKDGENLKFRIAAGEVLNIEFNERFKRSNPTLFSRAQGLVTIRMDDEPKPNWNGDTTDFFTFAHNLYVEDMHGRKILYAVGTDKDQGFLALDVSVPEKKPVVLSRWNEMYIHDLAIVRHEERILMIAASIYNGTVNVIDVTDPTAPSLRFAFETTAWPHNVDFLRTEDNRNALYLTHEDGGKPVTIWEISEDFMSATQRGRIDKNADNGAIPHNALITKTRAGRDCLWLSYYSEGVLVWDLSETPFEPRLLAHYDTSPATSGFSGVWGIFPYAQKRPNFVYASDIEEGLFILELEEPPFNGETPISVPWVTNVHGPKVVPEGFVVALFVVGLLLVVACIAFFGFLRWRAYRNDVQVM